jgi:hypothetical protein
MNFKEAVEKFLETDQAFVDKVSNPLYGPMDDKKVTAVLHHRTKLLADLVIFALKELHRRDEECGKTTNHH